MKKTLPSKTKEKLQQNIAEIDHVLTELVETLEQIKILLKLLTAESEHCRDISRK